MKKKFLSVLLMFVLICSIFTSCATNNEALNNNKTTTTTSSGSETKDKTREQSCEDKKTNDSTTVNKSTNDNFTKNKKNETTKKNDSTKQSNKKDSKKISVKEDGTYTSKEEVALYLNTYKKLPSNFITKNDARDLGWDSSKGNLWDVADGKSIGGDKFSNREKTLPTAKNRKYFECDINYKGGFRGAERIVYSNDGLVYYTSDHYKTFTLLYGQE